MRWSSILLSTLLVGVIFAGCASPNAKDNKVELGDGTQISLASANVTATKGSVSGVVVDEAIRPVPDANITVVGQARSARTSAAGLFVIEGLDPGFYTLSAQADGFTVMQTTVEIQSSIVSKVRMVLPFDATPRPYHVTYPFEWFDDYGQGFVDYAVDLVDEAFLNDTLPDACSRCRFEFETDPGVHTLVVEATWDDTVAFPLGQTSYFWKIDALTQGDYEADYFQNPGLAVVPADQFGDETRWAMTLASDENWVTMNQRAQIYVTAFYLAPPPEGWSFIQTLS